MPRQMVPPWRHEAFGRPLRATAPPRAESLPDQTTGFCGITLSSLPPCIFRRVMLVTIIAEFPDYCTAARSGHALTGNDPTTRLSTKDAASSGVPRAYH